MKNLKCCILFLLITSIYQVSQAQMPFSRGVNLTNWFQTSGANEIHFTKFTKQDFINIQSLGCDVIRLPINLHAMTNGSPDYTIEPLFFHFLDSAVRWAEDLEINLLIDNHTFDPAENTDPAIETALIKVWTQMADHYKDCSDYIYYEVLNEPHGIDDAVWGNIQQHVIDTIRAIDTRHTIIVGPAGWNSYNNLGLMPVYTDTNLIYTFHFYDPFMFTHQGASWVDPSMVPLAGVPFPYDPARMPSCPPVLNGTWIESNLNNYPVDGTAKKVKELIDIAVNFKNKHDVPMFCGEFGVYMPNSDEPDRVRWYDTVRSYLEEKEIAWTIWDYAGGFGIFKEGSDEMFEYDVNIPLIEALGLNIPQQKVMIINPDTVGFKIYSDYIEEKITGSSWAGEGVINYYWDINPFSDNYCIYWTGGSQYNFIGFDFRPDKDLTYLVENDFSLDFRVKGNTPGSTFDVRFLDTKTKDPDDHPWRMRYTIDQTIAEWNETWQHIHLPLKNFSEQGSWDNETWYNPVDDFDWAAVDRFEIVAEHSDMTGIIFFFDDVQVTNINTTAIQEKIPHGLTETNLIEIYPNPASHNPTIRYNVTGTGPVEISIYNILGQKVTTLVNEIKPEGEYSVIWNRDTDDAASLPGGLYFCSISALGKVQTVKIILGQEIF